MAGLGSCRAAESPTLDERPIVVLVHGNVAAHERFAPLAAELSELGVQPLCFRWVQRGRLTNAAHALAKALRELNRPGRMLIVGHSLGGLAARRAVTIEELPSLSSKIDLVTVATPFSGVRAAGACGQVWLRVLTLGTVSTICRRITRGSKWRDIHPTARLIAAPGRLAPYVRRHLHVVTNERGSCRHRGAGGECAKSDFVFTEAEQHLGRANDSRAEQIGVQAGHSQIVGGPPDSEQLLTVLQQHGLLPTLGSQVEPQVDRGG